MNGLNNTVFIIEVIHFLLAISVSLLSTCIYKSKYKMFTNDKFLERIIRDKGTFIYYISLVVLGAIFAVIFPTHIFKIFQWTFSFLMVISFGQYMSYSQASKNFKNTLYKNVMDAVDLLVISCWGAIVLTTLLDFNELLVKGCVMALFIVVSLWSINKLKYIEQDYLS